MAGIVSYGFYIPKFRLSVEEVAQRWGKNPAEVKKSLKVSEKAVSGLDEDALTMAYESSSMALSDLSVGREEIGAVFVGSESHPYAVNPTSTILAEFLGIEEEYLSVDTQFACKAATSAVIFSLEMVQSGFLKYALVSASDRATAKPHDPLEYTTASGSVSLVLGKKDVVLEAVDYTSFSSDTPDFWRREGIRYPSHTGRFTGKPSYFYHTQMASKRVLEKTGLKPSDFAFCVFHMPNGKFPVRVAENLGFTQEQLQPSLVVSNLGNSYSASALMGLVSVLEEAKKDDLIFFASFGSGAGSDAFVFKATEKLSEKRRVLSEKIKSAEHIDYATYLKFMGMI